MSIEAVGLLLQISNVPELDYCTIAEITDAVEELIDNDLVIKISENRLAVNKIKTIVRSETL